VSKGKENNLPQKLQKGLFSNINKGKEPQIISQIKSMQKNTELKAVVPNYGGKIESARGVLDIRQTVPRSRQPNLAKADFIVTESSKPIQLIQTVPQRQQFPQSTSSLEVSMPVERLGTSESMQESSI
jgi:hypothetical protein